VFTKEQLSAERRDYIQMYGSAMGLAIWEQEYNCSFNAAIIGGVFTAELAKLREEGRYAPCAYDPRYPVDTSIDIGVADLTVICWWQNVGTETRLIDVYASNSNGLEHYVQVIADKGFFYGTHFGCHDLANREFTSGTSRIDAARRLGLKWQLVPAIPKSDQIALGCQLMNRLVINSTLDLDTGNPVCEYAVDMLEQYHYRFDETRKVNSSQPVHDYSSHFCDAFMLYAVAKAKDTGFARPSGAPIMHDDRQYGRLSDIMRASSATSKSLWG
jgi:hypothetical protein